MRKFDLALAISAVSVLVLGCGDKEPAKPAAGEEPSGTVAPVDDGDRPKTGDEEATEKAEQPAVDERQQLLEAEYDLYLDKVLSHEADDLSDKDKALLGHLLKAAELIEELHMLQLNPQNLEWRKQIEQEGTGIEQQIFRRFQSPWCADNEVPACCALPHQPPKEIGTMHWPADLTDAEFEGLGKQINGDELLSPFTVVRRNERGGFDAVPFSKTTELGPRMKQVAAELRAAAEQAGNKPLKKFLGSRADAFEADYLFPYDASDFDWIALGGDWEVTVGPYETYKNPRQLKALFEMYIARENKEITAELARFKKNLQQMENALGELVGAEIYQSRKLDPRIAIRAVEVWMAAGETDAGTGGAIVAFHLPNRGRSVDEGLYKKVMMVNHSLAFEPVTKARAGLMLDPSQQPYVDATSGITNVTFHEFAHGFGAYHEMKVTNPKGKTTTVKEALKEHDSLLEELKADTFGLWLLSFQKKQGWVDDEQEKQRYTSSFMHILGLLQYPLPGTYPRMVAIQLGWYLDAGAVIWDAEAGRFKIDYAKLPAAVETLAKKVATIQLTGDYAQGVEPIEKYITKSGDKEYALKGTLGEARAVMVDKFKQAGIKSPSLRYEVTGL